MLHIIGNEAAFLHVKNLNVTFTKKHVSEVLLHMALLKCFENDFNTS